MSHPSLERQGSPKEYDDDAARFDDILPPFQAGGKRRQIETASSNILRANARETVLNSSNIAFAQMVQIDEGEATWALREISEKK